jgi:hypothetical protein
MNLFRIWKVPSSNLGQETVFTWLSIVPPGKCRPFEPFEAPRLPYILPALTLNRHILPCWWSRQNVLRNVGKRRLYSKASSSGSVVGIETGYGLVDRGVRVRIPVGSRILISLYRPDWLWDPPGLLSIEYRWLFSPGRGVKQQGREADHSPPNSAEVKQTLTCISRHDVVLKQLNTGSTVPLI